MTIEKEIEQLWLRELPKKEEAPIETPENVAEQAAPGAVTQTQEKVAETTETAKPAETTQTTTTPISLSEALNIKADPDKSAQLEQEKAFMQKYKHVFELDEKITKSEALKYIVSNFDSLDLQKAFANNEKSYNNVDLFDLKLEVARQKGIILTTEQIESDRAKHDAKWNDPDVLDSDRELYRAELLAQLPKGEDNSSYIEKEMQRRAEAAKLQSDAQLAEQAKWQDKEREMLAIKDRLPDVEILPGTGIKIEPETVSFVYDTLATGYAASPRFFTKDDKGKEEYQPHLEIEALAYEHIGRNADSVYKKGIEEGKRLAIEERTKTSQNSEVMSATETGKFTAEQLARRKEIFIAYSGNEQLRDAELKKENLL